VDEAQGGLEVVQRKTYKTPVDPEKPEVGLEGVAIVPPAPLTMLQAPVPEEGALAAKVVEVAQSTWSGPAFAAVGGPTNPITTSSAVEGQGALLMTQRKV
jgi:hypothetical protein